MAVTTVKLKNCKTKIRPKSAYPNQNQAYYEIQKC